MSHQESDTKSLFTVTEADVESPELHEGSGEPAPSKALERVSDIESRLQLAECDVDIQDELLEASLEEYQLHLRQLDTARAYLDTLLSKTAATLNLLTEITSSFKDVESQTAAFQEKSQVLLAQQQRYQSSAEGIREGLRYYDPLERITRRLNAPGAGVIVRNRDFPEMLVQLDESIDYMQTHPEQKEAESYRARYRQLLTRALTLVRTQFVNSVRETTTEVAQRIADKQLNDTTKSALLYAKFRVSAAEMKELGLEIQKRANPPADAEPGTEGEYQSLMDELHTAFAASRGRLVIPLLRNKLTEIAQTPSTSKDLVAFARSSISYVRGICLDEFELWGEWFHGQRGLYDFLESVCEPLCDRLRPRVIHEVKLLKLCQLCTLLQTRYMNYGEGEYEPPDVADLDFAFLIRPVLEDTQSRIVFRTQTVLRDEIERFKPKSSDFDYPARLQSQRVATSGRRVSQAQGSASELDNLDVNNPPRERWALPNFTTANGLSTPYQTLSRAVSLLSLIYRLLNSTVFDDLAHRIVHATTLSLIHASTLLKAEKMPQMKRTTESRSDSFDATANSQLFLLTHLMLLKSQIIAFDIEFYPHPEVSFDFTSLTNTFWELQAERGGLLNPLNLVRFVGQGRDLLPRVVNNMLDAKSELDGQLRKIISEFTAWEAGKMTAPLKNKGVDAGGEKARKAIADVRKLIEFEIPSLKRRLEEWMSDQRIRQTLLAAVREAVGQEYEAFSMSVETGVRQRGKSKPKTLAKSKMRKEDDDIWHIDAFIRWTEGLFDISEKDESPGGGESRSVSSDGSI